MVNSRTVMSQVEEFQLISHDIHVEGMSLNDAFQIITIVDKLPSFWKNFKNYLKHKLKEMRIDDLILRLRIEKIISYPKRKTNSFRP